MKLLVLDTETQSIEKGHPFHPDNFLCTVHYYSGESSNVGTLLIQYPDVDQAYGDTITRLQQLIDEHDVLILFNAKFDLHWLRRYGIKFQHKIIRDVQYLFYLLRAQEAKFPSLNQVLDYCELPPKQDAVKEFWDMGYLTSEIPESVLIPYGEGDAISTWQAYEILWSELVDRCDSAIINLYAVHMVDLLVLEDMEYNGDYYNLVENENARVKLQEEIDEINQWFSNLLPDIPDFNPGSNDQMSALLYGGNVYSIGKEQIGYFKSGIKIGEPRYKKVVTTLQLEGYIKPDKKWATAKEGYYSVDSNILRNINCRGMAKSIIDISLRRSKVTKQITSYCNSIPQLIEKFGWEVIDNHAIIHGNLNQCTAITGRLASSKPNKQNIDGVLKYLFESRY